jgi:hypothetical protein
MVPEEREKRPTAFVSYAQSSGPWQKQVLDFTTALRDPGGVDAELDLFHGADHQQWSTFGSDLIAESDFTLVAVDAAYRRRWLGREKKGVGAGAAREAATIKAIFEGDQKDFLRRVKIVLLPGADEEDIPDELRGYCEWFRIDSFDEGGLEPLLRSIWGRPAFPKPPLSPIPPLPPKAYANLEAETPVQGGDEFPSDSSKSASGAAEGPSASDEVKLRGRLEGVNAALEHVEAGAADPTAGSTPNREQLDLQQERTALEVSLEALADTGSPRTASRRRPRSRRAAPGGRPRRGRRRLTFSRRAEAAGLTSLVVLGLAVGVVTKDSADPASAVFASTEDLEVQGPPGWRRNDGRAAVGGLDLPDPVNLRPSVDADGPPTLAVAGISAAAGPTLLPAAYRSQVDEDTRRATVGLGSLEAYRYEDLKAPSSKDPVTVYVAPTSLGVATLACLGVGDDDRPAAHRCARIASTLRLSRGRAYPLGPSTALARALRGRLKRLTGLRQTAMRQMDRAEDASGQATAADSLAAAFRGAARGLAPVRVSPESAPAKKALLAALRSARDAYKSLAVAARKENGMRYEAAAAAAKEAEVAIDGRLEAMKRLGYQIGSGRN